MKIAPVLPGIQPPHPVAVNAVDEAPAPTSVVPSAAASASARMPVSPLEDSMEEVSMTFAEHVERKSKALNQRRVVAQPGSRAQQHIERIEKLDELLKLLEHPQHARLETQNQKMQTLLQHASSPGMDELLHAAGGDPARCDLLLRHTLLQAQRTQNSDLANKAMQSLELLHKEKGAEVSAGLNTASAIASFSTDPTQKQAMRQLYYQTIVHLQSGNAMLDALLNSFGGAHFNQGLRTLQRALADDIASRSSSIPRRALQKILSSLQDASNISQTLTASKTLLTRLAGKLPSVSFTSLELTRRLLNLSGNGAYLRDLQNLSRDVAGQHPHHQVLFLSGLVPLVYHLPLGLWRDDKSKNRQMALNLLRKVISDYAGQEPRASLTQPRTAL
ncbi:type III secretion system gatekeeper subunit SctW [Erwinia pyrifoliae]|uniref:Type III secretion system gatekeeper subunit SctW n=1 Tax=Erwinia pyrifoliae TaxID=79967 RepID=A0ABY5X704_ERWPY|nr:type III secretion system gatekeeper subunit SctW [Erwinia pyrifoliae]AUX71529.1 TyeA family type III secretion system gatekeeper subunit [Erwinia pyrifoliae]MCA8878251.1 YopN family type III secretion system gatekeeper subunit [Erwinia pyrifoliae]MCT2386012.1 type III secretion system gatekeeper subunit SctW [Erwinia pyrifoliae]MCU8588402.1 type III secretion system gatekeeper subunit SctW [Erwinia pyrifoliae]UWS33123.1 type III secretion system gatekeeper subunit SctW [Erwinia pyrifoliae]